MCKYRVSPGIFQFLWVIPSVSTPLWSILNSSYRGKLFYNKYKATLYNSLKYTISMIPFYWVNGPPNKKTWKTLLEKLYPQSMEKTLFEGKNILFGKVLFHLWIGSVITRMRGKKNSFAPKLIISHTRGMDGLHLQKRRIFYKVGKRYSNHILKDVLSRWILSYTEGRIV